MLTITNVLNNVKEIVELEETKFKGIDDKDELNLEYQVMCYRAIKM